MLSARIRWPSAPPPRPVNHLSIWIQSDQIRCPTFPEGSPLLFSPNGPANNGSLVLGPKKLQENASFSLKAPWGHIWCAFLEGPQRTGKQNLSTWGSCAPLKSLSLTWSVSPGHGEQAAHRGQEHHGSHKRAAKDVGTEEAGDCRAGRAGASGPWGCMALRSCLRGSGQ